MQRWYDLDPNLVVWFFARTEIISALCRRHREGRLSLDDLRNARRRLEILSSDWTEVTDHERVRSRAERLLGVHPLTAGDAVQLAAALVFVDEKPGGFTFVCLDQRLREAAEKEGFQALEHL